jgi:glycerol kinase
VSADLILALDQGTTSTRAALVDVEGRRGIEATIEHRQHHPAPGRVEHDATEILTAALSCAAEVLSLVDPARVAGVGIANQRETIVLWERATGRPVAPAIVWQDARTADACAQLSAAGGEELVRRRTGLTLQPYFSATKLAWLLDNVAGARARAERGELAAGTIDSWLAHSLTGSHITDVTNASRTLLFDTARLQWDDELLALFGIPTSLLPEIVPTWRTGGLATITAAGPLAGLPLLALVGDQQAALLGQACLQPGEAKCTYGTGAFLLANAGVRRPEPVAGLLASPAYQADDTPATYCVEGATAVAGGAVGWLADELGLLPDAASSAAVAATVESSAGVRVVPAFQGLYAPWWDATARGAILGLTLHSTGAHVVRATLEALAFQTRAVLEAAETDAGLEIPELRVDGGATANPVLLQAIADALGRPVSRALDPEATVRGAAFAAGLAAGLWPSTAVLADLRGPVATVEPVWDADRRDTEYADWLRAVDRARGWT